MKSEVETGIEELKRQFSSSNFNVREDGQGGAYVIMTPVHLGERFRPSESWLGFQIPAQYPYADLYPVFLGAEVARVDGTPFVPPITAGHQFEGRAALQISRRSGAIHTGLQKATAKILKILYFLENIT